MSEEYFVLVMEEYFGVCPSEGVFKQAEAGTVFRYADGRSYMLQECDSLHRKVFVPEPKYAIGLKKSPILEVCER